VKTGDNNGDAADRAFNFIVFANPVAKSGMLSILFIIFVILCYFHIKR
jgi:hypothetical protein